MNRRRITKQIFLGSGEHSMEQVALLHSRLDEALDFLGGLQQPYHGPVTIAIQASNLALAAEVQAIAEDLYVALTGIEPNPPKGEV